MFTQYASGKAFASALKGSGVNRDDLQAYWSNHHSGTLPAELTTRWQVYQQEVKDLDSAGVAAFTSASEAREPARPQCEKGLPAGGADRRLINVAVLDCDYWGIKGRSDLPVPTLTARFFMTEPAQADGSIFAELVDIMPVNASGGPVRQIVRLGK